MDALGARIQRFFDAVVLSTVNTRWNKDAVKRLAKARSEASTDEEPKSHLDLLVEHFNEWQAGRVEYSPEDYAQTHALQDKLGDYQQKAFLISVDSLQTVKSVARRLLEPSKGLLDPSGLSPSMLRLMKRPTAQMYLIRFPSTPSPMGDNNSTCDKFFIVLVLGGKVSSRRLLLHLKTLTPVACVLQTKLWKAILHSPCRSNKVKNWGRWKHIGLGKNKNLHPCMNRMSVLRASGKDEPEEPKKKKVKQPKEVDSSSSDEL
jgi:hypothetical protein